MPGELTVPLLYRRILRAAKLFPSIKRNAIIADIKLEFREGQVRWRSLLLTWACLCELW